jgi:hypothetical protein
MLLRRQVELPFLMQVWGQIHARARTEVSVLHQSGGSQRLDVVRKSTVQRVRARVFGIGPGSRQVVTQRGGREATLQPALLRTPEPGEDHQLPNLPFHEPPTCANTKSSGRSSEVPSHDYIHRITQGEFDMPYETTAYLIVGRNRPDDFYGNGLVAETFMVLDEHRRPVWRIGLGPRRTDYVCSSADRVLAQGLAAYLHRHCFSTLQGEPKLAGLVHVDDRGCRRVDTPTEEQATRLAVLFAKRSQIALTLLGGTCIVDSESAGLAAAGCPVQFADARGNAAKEH